MCQPQHLVPELKAKSFLGGELLGVQVLDLRLS